MVVVLKWQAWRQQYTGPLLSGAQSGKRASCAATSNILPNEIDLSRMLIAPMTHGQAQSWPLTVPSITLPPFTSYATQGCNDTGCAMAISKRRVDQHRVPESHRSLRVRSLRATKKARRSRLEREASTVSCVVVAALSHSDQLDRVMLGRRMSLDETGHSKCTGTVVVVSNRQLCRCGGCRETDRR